MQPHTHTQNTKISISAFETDAHLPLCIILQRIHTRRYTATADLSISAEVAQAFQLNLRCINIHQYHYT